MSIETTLIVFAVIFFGICFFGLLDLSAQFMQGHHSITQTSITVREPRIRTSVRVYNDDKIGIL